MKEGGCFVCTAGPLSPTTVTSLTMCTLTERLGGVNLTAGEEVK